MGGVALEQTAVVREGGKRRRVVVWGGVWGGEGGKEARGMPGMPLSTVTCVRARHGAGAHLWMYVSADAGSW